MLAPSPSSKGRQSLSFSCLGEGLDTSMTKNSLLEDSSLESPYFLASQMEMVWLISNISALLP